MDYSEKMKKCQEYVEALEEERRKIQVFHRELPLCLELVTQAIDGCKQQLTPTTTEYFPGRSQCSEQTSSEGTPVLEEFIPLKRASSEEEEEQSQKPKNNKDRNNEKSGKKSDWLRSVQLWSQSPDPPLSEDRPPKTSVIEMKKSGGAFHPFHREKGFTAKTAATSAAAAATPSSTATAATSSTAETGNGGSGRREVKEEQSNRKARRCWSPELHRRFLQALQQLGGSHAGTPKQIRELMKVDGLTNDEVKSHLQKYRLHTRRPTPTIHNNGNPQQPQFVVVGGLWVPPPEYTAVVATTGEATSAATANGIYAPVAAPPPPVASAQQQQQKQSHRSPTGPLHSEERGASEHSLGDHNHSNSPATSSSTHTTTASPAF
ncbi:hypothetical protein HHK36_015020 [Tetracentron sinense]|uniref:HTH myb-type domain-containing protein n=1 Tax=Tetracentron sinense TaxID=13715 RepID=A0A834Z2A4_TETSI|nr:hypothetical protein HHK36_015020 [Tetracentron sinense]